MACRKCGAPCQGRLCRQHEIERKHEDGIGEEQRDLLARSQRRARERREAEDD